MVDESGTALSPQEKEAAFYAAEQQGGKSYWPIPDGYNGEKDAMPRDREELIKRARNVHTLPMMSNMMVEVFRVMADPDSSFGQLYGVVKYDQAISSRIISIANSPYYNRGTPVTSLERAMVMVGYREIERIIMCLVFMKQIMSPWKLAQDDMQPYGSIHSPLPMRQRP